MAGQNCVYAIKQAHASKASRYFWMDALCIDQNTAREKSHQVGMMGQIYARSKHVLACVGSHTDNSTSLIRAIDKNRSLLDIIHALALGSAIKKIDHWVMPNPIPRISGVADRCLIMVSPPEREALATDFIAFMNRPYFSRVWVLQELHLAPATSLCCGMDRRPFAFLLAVSILIDFWINVSGYRATLSNVVSTAACECGRGNPCLPRRQTSCLPLRLHEGFLNIEAQRGCLGLATGFRGRRRLREVLDAMQKFQCTDVRDRLFGVLALIEWGSGEPAVPDYSKDNYEVAIQVLRLHLQNPESNPVSGLAVVDWARMLCEIFQVNIEARAVQQAIAVRHGSQFFSNKFWSIHDRKVEPDSPSKFREKWYGIQLCYNTIIGRETSIPGDLPDPYLCCSTHESTHEFDFGVPYVEILDQMQRVYGYAPAETRPSDWLIFGEEGVLDNASSMMAIVRSVDDGRRSYTIIGQASKNRDYKCRILRKLEWRYFCVNWNGNMEDLFLFGSMYKTLPAYSETFEKSQAT